ncbi:MAG: hypothetical protein IKC89_07715 [Lentisphaeria bacterium]|nr:hypothetical protein [Lentisphaeria bacterium]
MSKRPSPFLLLLAVIFTAFAPMTTPSAHAIEPSALITAAPHAAQLAKLWSPQLFRALGSTGTGLYKMGAATLNIFRLPLGLLQCTAGAPFGFFSDGASNVAQGLIAPCELLLQTVLLPVRIISLGTIY